MSRKKGLVTSKLVVILLAIFLLLFVLGAFDKLYASIKSGAEKGWIKYISKDEGEVGKGVVVSPSDSVVGITVTERQIDEYLKKSAKYSLKDQAHNFYFYGQTYGIDPAFAIAVAMFESGGGTSSAARNKNNYFGIGPGKYFSSPTEGVEAFYKLIKNNYLSKEQDTVEKMIAPELCNVPNRDDYFCCRINHCYCCHTTEGYESWLTKVPEYRKSVQSM